MRHRTTDTYARLRKAEDEDGRLPHCATLFPNIEMRLGLGTAAGAWVNVHLLVSPEDPNHLTELNRILSNITFTALDDRFSCTPADLARLGFAADPSIRDEGAARRHGSTQFKVSFDQLKEIFSSFRWARDNIVVAVAAGADGTSGLRDGADATLRREVETQACPSTEPGESLPSTVWRERRSPRRGTSRFVEPMMPKLQTPKRSSIRVSIP